MPIKPVTYYTFAALAAYASDAIRIAHIKSEIAWNVRFNPFNGIGLVPKA